MNVIFSKYADYYDALYKDKNYYEDLSLNAYTAVRENLNWETTSKNLLKLYH